MKSRTAFSIKDLLAATLLLAVGFTWPAVLPVAVGLIVMWLGLDLLYAMVAVGAVALLQMATMTG